MTKSIFGPDIKTIYPLHFFSLNWFQICVSKKNEMIAGWKNASYKRIKKMKLKENDKESN